jgi:hypothetical protein
MNKTLCLLANSKVGDLYGAKIVSMLKSKYNLSDIQLIGNAGYIKILNQRTSL